MSSVTLPYSFETGSLSDPGAHSQQALEIFLSLPPTVPGLSIHVCLLLACYVGAGMHTGPDGCTTSALSHQAISLSLCFQILLTLQPVLPLPLLLSLN